MVSQLALGAIIAALSSCSSATTGPNNATTTTGATKGPVEEEGNAVNNQAESSSNAVAGKSGAKVSDQQDKTKKPSGPKVQPSPWQPPAEIDPVPPPVEGTEPK